MNCMQTAFVISVYYDYDYCELLYKYEKYLVLFDTFNKYYNRFANTNF